ncbi:hypothetical protein IMCC3317_20610 [Kordia antarctica]|uniref:Uncharacterized protein n=1 Tax=Kordia antarctica TaxID=1218801 RepID=A0A7L4ZKE8_9FLAO|nr:hypothetical protein [Kordia antarctica]QHI36696.1 hypothetical protein IMCC3317_20610 [Kordia antarctica]
MVKVDVIVNYFVALAVPRIVFVILKMTKEFGGGPAINSSLKDISFRYGMEEGIGVLIFLGILLYNLSNRLVHKYYSDKIKKERKENKLLTNEILKQINMYPISKPLKQKLISAYILQTYY